MAFLLHQARFFTTVNHLRDLPATARPEIAFAGRSNAGKSTAINLLCNQKRLAFASKTPGRTQHINYFSVGPADEPAGYLVDLPGYGYAEVPEASKAHWEALLSAYLRTRPQLCGLILMMDARRPLTDLDRQMIEWFAPTGRPIHALLTKCDKLTRQESVVALRNTNKGFDEYRKEGYEGVLSAQLFSALKRVGLDEAHAVIENWLVPKPAQTADEDAVA
jgi:GTP-binding protein